MKTSLLVSFLCVVACPCVLAFNGDMGLGAEPLTDGSASYPYLIEDVNDFDTFADTANAATYWAAGVHTTLMTDIDLSGRTYTTAVIAPDTNNSGSEFNGPDFKGVFDGNGFSLLELMINDNGTGNDYLGLFGYLGEGSLVIDLNIVGVNVTGGADVREIAGLCSVNIGKVNNCSINGTVIGSDIGQYTNAVGGLCGANGGIIISCNSDVSVKGGDYVGILCGFNSGYMDGCIATGVVEKGNGPHLGGGLCGWNRGGAILNCISSGSVKGNDKVGGLCGYNTTFGLIINSSSTSSVTGDSELGGLCGANLASAIINCYATGNVTGNSYLGGLCGLNADGSSDWGISTIDNSYSTGTILGSTILGGFCGYNEEPEGTINNCYFLNNSGPDNGIGMLRTDSQMKQQSTFTKWDFVGNITDGTSSVWFIEPDCYPTLFVFNENFSYHAFQGQGTESDPYQIYDINDLGAIWQKPKNHFRLMNDINLNDTQWSSAIIPYFDGDFNGSHYQISNLSISDGSHLGLFGQVFRNGNIYNIRLKDVSLVGSNGSCYLGAVCGINFGSISQCSSSGFISSGDYSKNIGGLCGAIDWSTIQKCYSTVSVASGNNSIRIGGLNGGNSLSGMINDCCASGAITTGDNSVQVGGLSGSNSRGFINNCYSTGNVFAGNGSSSIGGLCGEIYTINNSYFINTSGPNNGAGIPLDNPNMMIQANFIGWDFVNDWMMLREGEDYPRLAWQEIFAGDIAGLYGVDMVDFARLASQWGETACHEQNQWCQGADIDHADGVDMKDLITVAENWLCK